MLFCWRHSNARLPHSSRFSASGYHGPTRLVPSSYSVLVNEAGESGTARAPDRMMSSPRKTVEVRGAHSSNTATSGAAFFVVLPEVKSRAHGLAPRGFRRVGVDLRVLFRHLIRYWSVRRGKRDCARAGSHDELSAKNRRGSWCPLVEHRDEWGSLLHGAARS